MSWSWYTVSELTNLATASLEFCKFHALWIESLIDCRFLRRVCEFVCTWWNSKTPRNCLSLLSLLFFFLEYIKQHFKNSFKHPSCPLLNERAFPGQVCISSPLLHSCFFYNQCPQRYAVSPPTFFLHLKTLTTPLAVSTKCSKGGQSSETVKIIQVSWKQFFGREKLSFPCHDCQKNLFTYHLCKNLHRGKRRKSSHASDCPSQRNRFSGSWHLF